MESSFLLASGCWYSHFLGLRICYGSVFLDHVGHGATVNPIRGTFPLSVCLVRVMASYMYFRDTFTSGTIKVSMSSGTTKGLSKTGPTPGFISTFIPKAWGVTRTSENMMAASKENLWMAWVAMSFYKPALASGRQ